LFYIVRSPTCEVFYIGAFAVEIGEYYDFLFVVLTQILRYDHVIVRIGIVQLYYVVISSEIVGYFTLERCAGEPSPKYFFSLDHGLVRFADTPV